MTSLSQRPATYRVTFSLHHWFIASCSFSFLLVCARVTATGTLTYAFLLWNLFLAILPYLISSWLSNNIKAIDNKWILVPSLALWLLFIPNSFYILTDLFHLRHILTAPKWFDLLLLLSFALNGLLFGIASLRAIEVLMGAIFGGKFSVTIIFVVMWLNALGIYIGRYLRYNSWDVVTQPFALFNSMRSMVFDPVDNTMEWGMISCYALFMSFLYLTIKKLAEQFNQQS